MKHTCINMEQVKISNRSSILKLINDCGPISRKDIALTTGLTAAAVTLICTSLIEEGILTETGTDESSKNSGRKKVFVNIDYDAFHVLTVAIEMEQTVIAICNMKGYVYAKKVLPTNKSVEPDVFLKEISTEAKKLMAKEECKNLKIRTACVTVPGIVDIKNGKSLHSYGIWDKEVEVRRILNEYLGMKIILENNVNAFTTAELLFNTGKIVDNFLIIKWGPGVGSSIVIDHKLYEGSLGKAAELGHIIVDPKGKKCSCGKSGCLQTKISYSALNDIKAFSAEEFGKAVTESNDSERLKFEEAFSLFSTAIVNCITTLAPNKVVLCGKLFADSTIRNKIISGCEMLDPNANSSKINYTTLHENEEIIGPVALFLQDELFQQI